MNKRRLLKLADLLEADARNEKGIKFDLRIIGRPIRDDGERGDFKAGDVVAVNCNTAACAVGLACISGAFSEDGLTFTIGETGELDPVFGDKVGWNIAETSFFDLKVRESEFLFTSWNYPSDQELKGAIGERYVAKRIRDFVAGKVSPA